MHRNRKFGIVLLTVGLVSLFFHVKKLIRAKEEIDIERKQKAALIKNKSSSSRISLKEARYTKERSKDSVKSTFPDSCESTFKDLAQMTASEYTNILVDQEQFKSFFNETCLKNLSSNELFNKYANAANCNILDPNFVFDENTPQSGCSTLLFILKAQYIVDQSSGLKIEDMTSQELAAHFAKMFFNLDKLDKKSLEENMKLIDSLYNRHSDDPSVVEAYLGYMIIGQQITQESSLDSKIQETFEQSSGKSFRVDRLSILKSIVNKDLTSAKKSLDKLSQIYPNEPELKYYQAAYYWKTKNKNEALNYIKKAINMSSSCSYCTPELYKQTLENLKKAKLGQDNLFSLSIGLNFESL